MYMICVDVVLSTYWIWDQIYMWTVVGYMQMPGQFIKEILMPVEIPESSPLEDMVANLHLLSSFFLS